MKNRKNAVAACLVAMLFLFAGTAAYAALTLDATTITSDGAMTLTTASGSNVTVTRGVSANAATTTDSLYVGGLAQFTGATASGTAIVIGADVSLFRSAANLLTLQGGLSMTSATASATALVIGTDVPLFRNAANQLRLQGTLSASAGGLFNAATTTDSLYIGGRGIFAGSSVSLATSTATTTRSVFVSAPKGTVTTTIEVSGPKGSRGSCLELWQENAAYRVYVTNGNALVVQAGSCRD